jgi:hypothetical protein
MTPASANALHESAFRFPVVSQRAENDQWGEERVRRIRLDLAAHENELRR